MDFFAAIQQRIGAVIAAVGAGVCFCLMGGFFAFMISPQQAMEWRRIEALPELTAATYADVAIGDEVAITGALEGNETIGRDGLVAYTVDEWDVTPESNNNGTRTAPSGTWKHKESRLPSLSVALQDGVIKTAEVGGATLSGTLAEFIDPGTGVEKADYNNQSLPEGSLRTQGFRNGDLITVVGKKGSGSLLQPDRLFGGNRAGLVEEIRFGAQLMFWIGLGMMACSPFVIVGGIWGAVFGRMRNTGGLSGLSDIAKGLKIG